MRRIGKKGVILIAALLVAGSVILADHVASKRRLDRILADADLALDHRDFPVASSQLNEYLDARPDDSSVRLLAAQTARRQGDFAAARRHLRFYEEHKGPPEPRLREEQLLLAQEDGSWDADDLIASCLSPSPPQDVDLVLEVAIEQQLKLIEHASNTGKTLVEGPYAKARSQTEQAIGIWLQRRPGQADQVQGLIWRGKLNLLSNPRAAIDDFRRATDLDPNHYNARLNLAISLIEYDVSEAAEHLEILHARKPEDEQVIMLLARARRSLGHPEGAIDLLDQLLERSPEFTAAVLERGKAALDLGRPKEAEKFLRMALDQTPNDPFVHLALSRCLLLTGKEQEAKRHEQLYKSIQLENLKAEEDRAKVRREWQNKKDRGENIPRPNSPVR